MDAEKLVDSFLLLYSIVGYLVGAAIVTGIVAVGIVNLYHWVSRNMGK